MEITLERFKCKPVKQIVLGEEMEIPALKTKHYVSLLKSQMIETKILAKRLDEQEPTLEELEEKAEIDREIAYSVVSEICPEMTKEFFDNEVPAVAIYQIIEGATKASGLTDEKLMEVKEKFNRMQKLRQEEKMKNESNTNKSQ